MVIEHITCLSCGGHSFARDENEHLLCNFCGSVFRTKDTVCPHCNTVNQVNSLHCIKCNQRLSRTCSVCSHVNRGDAEVCDNCATQLDIIEFITRRYRDSAEGFLGTRSKELVEIKKQDQEFMAAQSARFKEEEKKRQAALKTQREDFKERERKLIFTTVGIVIGALALAGVVILLLTVVFGGQ